LNIGISCELNQLVQTAAQFPERPILPPDVPFFHRQMASIVEELSDYEGQLSTKSDLAAYQETLKILLPFVDLITQPRSLDEFQELKRSLLEFFADPECK
jgi:hypothetical protein